MNESVAHRSLALFWQSFANPKLVFLGSSSPLASLLILGIHHQIQLTGHNSTVFVLQNSCQAFFCLSDFFIYERRTAKTETACRERRRPA